jgi:hypothetical protein
MRNFVYTSGEMTFVGIAEAISFYFCTSERAGMKPGWFSPRKAEELQTRV